MGRKLIFLLVFVLSFQCFCFASGTPVIDVSLIYETILQKMDALEQYAKEIEHMKTQMDHYVEQYNQIQRYYQELEGLTDKLLSSESFSTAWNTTKSILRKCVSINKTRGNMEDEAFRMVVGIMDQHAACVEYLNKQHTLQNEYDSMKMKLLVRYNNRIEYYQDAFMNAYNRNTKAFEERQARKNDAREYNQTLLREAEKKSSELNQYMAYLEANDENLRLLIETLKAEKNEIISIKADLMDAYNEYYTQHQSFIEGGNQTEAQRKDLETTLDATASMIDQMDSRIKDINSRLEVYAYYLERNDYTTIDYEAELAIINDEIAMYEKELERLGNID